MEDVKNVLVGNFIGTIIVASAAVGIFGATIGMCAVCTLGLYLAGG